MIQITIPKIELYDEKTELFEYPVEKPITLQLEHSLISIQKWESKWHKPFLSEGKKTTEETLDYIRCMTLTPNVDPNVYKYIPETEMKRVSEYIDNPMTATWFGSNNQPGSSSPKKEIITAEVIYYWMISFNIPTEYRKWHLNQLITLIRVLSAKNAPKKKRSQKDILAENKRINAARRAKLKSKG